MKRVVIGTGLAALVLLVYSNHFGNGFHFDDKHTIVSNSYIRSLRNIPLFFRDARTFSTLPTHQTYRPVVSMSLAVDYALGNGLNPFFFHLSTFILYLVQGVAMFFLFRKILRTSTPGLQPDLLSGFAVAWYLLHPANAETINYIISRSDTLSTLGVVLALALWACAPRFRRAHAYLVPAALGMLAKPVAVVFAPLLYLFELSFGDAPARDSKLRASRAKRLAYAALPALALTVVLLALIKFMSPATWVAGGLSRFRYMITQPFVILHYFSSFFLPLGLSANTDWQPLASVADVRFLAGTAFLALLTAGIVISARSLRWRPVSFGLAWFLIGVIPTSFVFPLAEVLNDHRVFLPYVGLSLAATAAGALLVERAASTPGRRRILRLTVGVLAMFALLGYAVWTYRRNEIWRTDETLWKNVTITSPKDPGGWMSYGNVLTAKGDYSGAEHAYRTALTLAPSYMYLHVNIGVLQAATGRDAAAEGSFKTALALGRNRPEPYLFYARFLADRRRNVEAISLLRTALPWSPASIDIRHLLLELYRDTGDRAALAALAQETLRIIPGDPESLAALKAARLDGFGAATR